MATSRTLKRIESAQAALAAAAKDAAPDQRTKLLEQAGVGMASQARVVGKAFRTLEAALEASDEIRVGKGGNGRVVSRPNWDVRTRAAKAIWEMLGAAASRQGAASAQPGGTVVNVVVPSYARGEVIDVQPAATDGVLSDGVLSEGVRPEGVLPEGVGTDGTDPD